MHKGVIDYSLYLVTDRDTIKKVMDTGVDGAAVVSAIVASTDLYEVAQKLRQLISR